MKHVDNKSKEKSIPEKGASDSKRNYKPRFLRKTKTETHLKKSIECSNCQHPIEEHQDICPNCHSWLCGNTCRFCYTPIADGASFCNECGNSINGTKCKKCGKTSFFHFCTECKIPVTEQALILTKEIEKDADFIELRNTLEKIKVTEIEISEILDAAKSLDSNIIETAVETNKDDIPQKPETRRYFSQEEISLILNKIKSGNSKTDPEPENKKTDQAKPKKKDIKKVNIEHIKVKNNSDIDAKINTKEMLIEEMSVVLKKMKEKRFTDNQSARNYHMARIPKQPREPVGWVCNYRDVLHPTPNDCCDASLGGYWTFNWYGKSNKNEIEWEYRNDW